MKPSEEKPHTHKLQLPTVPASVCLFLTPLFPLSSSILCCFPLLSSPISLLIFSPSPRRALGQSRGWGWGGRFKHRQRTRKQFCRQRWAAGRQTHSLWRPSSDQSAEVSPSASLSLPCGTIKPPRHSTPSRPRWLGFI